MKDQAIRILVVDDQQEILDVTTTVLEGAGHNVTAVRSGGEALKQLAEQAFDMVLLDINMPGMDGWEVLRLIRVDEELANLPIAMFSIKGEIHDKIQGMQDGADDYITKPFVVDELLARVRKILDRPKGRRRPRSAPGPVS
jgi:DNA-binding response OmpR family regulator